MDFEGLGDILGPLGAHWDLLGDVGAILGRHGAVLGRGWDCLGTRMGLLGAMLAPSLGPSWNFLRASGDPPEASWGFVKAYWHVFDGT